MAALSAKARTICRWSLKIVTAWVRQVVMLRPYYEQRLAA